MKYRHKTQTLEKPTHYEFYHETVVLGRSINYREVRSIPYGIKREGYIPRGEMRLYYNRVEYKVSGEQPPHLKGSARGVIDPAFSRKSRKRLLNCMNAWRIPRAGKLKFITLTYPDIYPLDWQQWKADLEAIRRKILDVFPGSEGIWRLELQQRGAPHYHLILWIPKAVCPSQSTLKRLITQWWAKIAHSEDKYEGKYATNVRAVHSHLHAYRYCAKYASKPAQHPVDNDGVICDGDDIPNATMGRLWGKIGKPNCDAYLCLSFIPHTSYATIRKECAALAEAGGFSYAAHLKSGRNPFESFDLYGVKFHEWLCLSGNTRSGTLMHDDEYWSAIEQLRRDYK